MHMASTKLGQCLPDMLADYLGEISSRRWQLGALDCCTFMADWLVLSGLPDPMADIRGSYSNERQFLRISRPEGGFENACAARLASIGMVPTLVPKEGDPMLVNAPFAMRKGKVQSRPTGAICLSETRRAVVTSDMGLIISGADRLPMVKAWTFNA